MQGPGESVVSDKQKIQTFLSHMIHPGRICRRCESDNESLLKVRGKSYKRPRWARYEAGEREIVLSYQVFLKGGSSLCEGQSMAGSRSPIIHE
jgi:hypothetical protein